VFECLISFFVYGLYPYSTKLAILSLNSLKLTLLSQFESIDLNMI
jgi:hypothetical protein